MKNEELISAVRDQYASVAKSADSQPSRGVDAVAQAFGYSAEQLASLPPTANLGLSCGNPTALAGLREGEVVVDLGCGAGIDVLLAARQVGETGRAIGIDMTPEMLERARTNAAQTGVTNVEFHQATIDALPLEDDSVDCVLSNCVINLAPDKRKVFHEIRRVLKPGGRVVISDIALRQPLPENVAQNVAAHVGCIAGALLISEYERLLREAGFEAVVVQDTGADLNAYAQAGAAGCCGPTDAVGCGGADATTEESPGLHEQLADLLKSFDVNAFAASVRVHAVNGPLSGEAAAPTAIPGQSSATANVRSACCSDSTCPSEGEAGAAQGDRDALAIVNPPKCC